MRRFLTLFILIVLIGAGVSTAIAQARSSSGLPLPRFVTLRSGEVNLRAGPGVRYPVEWVYRKRHLPVEIIAEYDTWRNWPKLQTVKTVKSCLELRILIPIVCKNATQ